MLKKLGISAFLLCVYTSQALASGVGEHGGNVHHKTNGLPQFDPSSYASQSFWLIVIFVIMYFFYSKKALPQISKVIENRTERINSDLDSAERLREEVATVQKSYEDKLVQTRREAAALFSDVEKEIKAKTEQYNHDFQSYAAKEIKKLEKSIEKARDKAMKDMVNIAADIAIEATEKIIGVSADKDKAIKIVETINNAS